MKIKRALVSVSNKEGVVELARQLQELGVDVISTGGTAKTLREAGIAVIDVSDVTGFPEMMDGRLKTLDPHVHGGILGIRSNPQHMASMQEHGIRPIDLVVVNLYPFEATIAKPGCTFATAIENIDIGGPTMLRAAAKNHRDVVVVVDPGYYGTILQELKETGDVGQRMRRFLAQKVFEHTHQYDLAISDYLIANLETGL